MKYVLFIFILTFTLSTQAQKNFKLKGNVDGFPSGEICLISAVNHQDTLSKAPIINGKFRLTGQVSSPQPVYLRIKTLINGPVLFLENTTFTIQLKVIESYLPSANGEMHPVKELADEIHSGIQGGRDQKMANHFYQLLLPAQQKYDTLQHLYLKAQKENDVTALKELEKQDQEIRRQMISQVRQLIADYSDSYVTAYLILEYLIDLYEEEKDVRELYELLSFQVRTGLYGEKIAKEINYSSKRLAKNATIPDFTLTTLDNTPLSLADIKGEIKILDFWAAFCAPCLEEMPELVKLYELYQPKGVEIVLITLDRNKEAAKKLQKKLKTSWIYAGKFRPDDSRIEDLFHLRALPYRIILDKNNRMINQGNLSLYRIKEIIDKKLKETDKPEN